MGKFFRDEIFIFRVLFVLLVTWVGYQIGSSRYPPAGGYTLANQYTIVSFFLALFFVVVEYSTSIISSKKILLGVFGLMAGLVVARLAFIPVNPAIMAEWQAQMLYNLIFGFIGVILALKNADHFDASKLKFIVSSPLNETKVLDTSVIIDGRVWELIKQNFIKGPFMVPEFVLAELQTLADSSDSAKRAKGRRGLDLLDEMQESDIDLTILEKDYPDVQGVDQKLMQVVQEMGGVLLTNDFNLHKVAQLHDVTVMNFNELASVMKPTTYIGEIISLQIAKEGKEHGQGVGYLEDGTMVVVEEGVGLIGVETEVSIVSILHTPGGRMIFAKPQNPSASIPNSQQRPRRQTGAKIEPIKVGGKKRG